MSTAIREKITNAVVEALETRRHLSAVKVTDGALVLVGDANSSNKFTIAVDKASGSVTATANGVSRTYSLANIDRARIWSGTQADSVDIAADFTKPAYVRTGDGNDTINAGGGD